MPNVVTANRLIDGIVVYLAPDGGWVEELARAKLADTEDETKALESEAAKAVAERARRRRLSHGGRAQRRRAGCHFPCASASAPPTEPL